MVAKNMADPGPLAAPELVEQHSSEASPEVKSKLGARKKVTTTPAPKENVYADTKFDRQPVFLIMASGQIESAEVTWGGKRLWVLWLVGIHCFAVDPRI